ncbi:MAG: hypothetical protein QOI64_1671 [Solirubrobacteraceae bacterium]|jgi:hypothetical protein|nr:hypothetical protein [Solirubrobacteraceae bacterium]
MEAAQLVMLIAVCLAIVVIAAWLITVVTFLGLIWSRINTILGVVGGVVDKTVPLGPVIGEIKADIAGGEGAVVAAVERLKVRKGYTEPRFDDDRDREPAGIGTSTDVAPPPSTFRNF